jgi:hypothetical protein
MKRHRSCVVPFVLALALASSTAAAEKPKAPAHADAYTYAFTDDALLASATGVMGVPIIVRLPPVRVTLIRPRTNFVPELLKSVENL